MLYFNSTNGFFKILQKNVNYKAIGISMDWQNEPL